MSPIFARCSLNDSPLHINKSVQIQRYAIRKRGLRKRGMPPFIPSHRAKLLFCEGKPDNLDYAILARLVGNPNIVIPAGGKYGLMNGG